MSTEVAKRGSSLFAIEQSLVMLMQDREEVTDPEEIAAVEQAIRQYVETEIRKVDSIRGFIRDEEIKVAAAKEEAARATAFAQAHQARIDRVKAYCMEAMQLAGVRKLEGRAGHLAIRGNGGLAPLKIQDDVLPDEYKTITITLPLDMYRRLKAAFYLQVVSEGVTYPANTLIREALKRGEAVPGAYLAERGERLEVR